MFNTWLNKLTAGSLTASDVVAAAGIVVERCILLFSKTLVTLLTRGGVGVVKNEDSCKVSCLCLLLLFAASSVILVVVVVEFVCGAGASTTTGGG